MPILKDRRGRGLACTLWWRHAVDGSRTRPVSSHEELTGPHVDQGVCVRQGHGLKTLYNALLYMLFAVCNTVEMTLVV